LHLSDTHFGTELRGPAEALRELVREQQPALAVISGDLTQRARRAQFRAARAFLDALGVPAVLAIPGNHDIPLFNVL
ncbi:metallophosphoesterase, partial [Vibrio parahaemolyticus]